MTPAGRRILLVFLAVAAVAAVTLAAWRWASDRASRRTFSGTAQLTEQGQALRDIRARLAFGGTLVDGTYRVLVPRPGLTILHLGRVVPDAIGIESEARFYLCACGSAVVLGHVLVPEYELDTMQRSVEETGVQVNGSVPLIAGSVPPVYELRFQYDGTPTDVADRANAVLKLAAVPPVRGEPATAPSPATSPSTEPSTPADASAEPRSDAR